MPIKYGERYSVNTNSPRTVGCLDMLPGVLEFFRNFQKLFSKVSGVGKFWGDKG